MIRHPFLPALAAGLTALLAGCVTDYQYRGGTGDYYYGQPAVEYRDYGYGYGDPYGSYGYPGGWSGSIGYGYGVGGGLYGGYGGYGDGYPYGGYGSPYWGRPTILVRPGGHGGHHRRDHPDNDGDADDAPAGPSGALPRRDRDDAGITATRVPNALPSERPRPMIAIPSSPRLERGDERRMQPVRPRGGERERDGGLTPTP